MPTSITPTITIPIADRSSPRRAHGSGHAPFFFSCRRSTRGGDRLGEGLDRGARSLRVVPHGGDDGEEIGAGGDQRRTVLRRDAADGDTRHRHHLAPPLDDL